MYQTLWIADLDPSEEDEIRDLKKHVEQLGGFLHIEVRKALPVPEGPAFEYLPKEVTLDRRLVMDLLEPLRLAYIYVLKDSHPEQLGDDFKPWKWSNEIGFAEECSIAYRKLLDALVAEQNERGEV